MNRRFFLTLLSAYAVRTSAAAGADEDTDEDADEDKSGLSANELIQFTPISEGVSRASALVLYEGLPHPFWEAEKFKRELGTKKTVRFHDYPFYERPLHVAEEEIGSLRRLSAAADSYWSYGGPKFCGAYHPDYCLAWKGDAATYDLLICFGCGEMKLYGAERMLVVDVRRDTFRQFETTLKKYRNQRPS
jgi:hypothetical protein